tara:strand:+ start:3405 stop:3803 length:399 start_codon:yes stop_codon:yes gene_type:complete
MKEIIITNEEKLLIYSVVKGSGVSMTLIQSKKRDREIAIARNILGYLLRTKLKCKQQRAADIINTSHCSIVVYLKNWHDNYKYYPEYKKCYDKILILYESNYYNINLKMDLVRAQITDIEKTLKKLKKEIHY